MKVTIDAGGRTVRIDIADTDLNTVADKALAMWKATEGAAEKLGGAVGFVAERAEMAAEVRA